MSNELLTPPQVAKLLQVHPATLANWRHQGKGPAYVRLGNGPRKMVRYPSQAVDAWIKGRP
jgi:predicted DNA-binding transcriptional regulator AlpA